MTSVQERTLASKPSFFALLRPHLTLPFPSSSHVAMGDRTSSYNHETARATGDTSHCLGERQKPFSRARAHVRRGRRTSRERRNAEHDGSSGSFAFVTTRRGHRDDQELNRHTFFSRRDAEGAEEPRILWFEQQGLQGKPTGRLTSLLSLTFFLLLFRASLTFPAALRLRASRLLSFQGMPEPLFSRRDAKTQSRHQRQNAGCLRRNLAIVMILIVSRRHSLCGLCASARDSCSLEELPEDGGILAPMNRAVPVRADRTFNVESARDPAAHREPITAVRMRNSDLGQSGSESLHPVMSLPRVVRCRA